MNSKVARAPLAVIGLCASLTAALAEPCSLERLLTGPTVGKTDKLNALDESVLAQRKARLSEALKAQHLLGPGSASEELCALVQDGYVDKELGEMARSLSTAARDALEKTYQRALRRDTLSVEARREVSQLLELARQTGPLSPRITSHVQFLQGVMELREERFVEAAKLFEKACVVLPSEPAPDPEQYVFWAEAMYRAGNTEGAVTLMRAKLPQDPRTAVLVVASSMNVAPGAGANALKVLLFERRMASGPSSK